MITNFTPVIGMEVHVELNMNTKMFCGCPAHHFGEEPNSHTCPVCLGLPGALPVANKEGIRRTIKIGLALECAIASHSKFDRKNYFYPDLPKGYQISQYDEPLCVDGFLETKLGKVGIHRVHLEEDTAKLQHVTLTEEEQKKVGVKSANVSLIDFNRSGVALVEIVTEPDIHSPEQAREYAKNLVHILRFLGVSDCDMEKGSLRLEANISVQTDEEKAAGKLPPYKVEVKNLNSFRFLERAIRYEIERQSKLRAEGKIPTQETRGWKDAKNESYSQRVKEEAEDYRYFPDPDLPPLELTTEFIQEISDEMPELPQDRIDRLQEEFGISEQNAVVFAAEAGVAERAERLLKAAKAKNLDPQKVANAVVNNKIKTTLLQSEVADEEKEMVKILEQFEKLSQTDDVNDEELQKAIEKVISDPSNSKPLAGLKAGEERFLGFFIGQVMRELGKKTDPQQVRQAIQKIISKN